jgi:hypothetical protein
MTNDTGITPPSRLLDRRRRRRDGGLPFVMVPIAMIGTVSPVAFVTYAAVGAHTSARDGTAWPGQRVLAAELELSRRTVQRALDELVKSGFLTVEAAHRPDGGRAENIYRVVPLGAVDNPVE